MKAHDKDYKLVKKYMLAYVPIELKEELQTVFRNVENNMKLPKNDRPRFPIGPELNTWLKVIGINL